MVMEARFIQHGIAGRYFTVTPAGGVPFLVVVTEDIKGTVTFELLGLRPRGERIPAMIAVLNTMNAAVAVTG